MKSNLWESILFLIVGTLSGASGIYWFLNGNFQEASVWMVLFNSLRTLFGLIAIIAGITGILRNRNI